MSEELFSALNATGKQRTVQLTTMHGVSQINVNAVADLVVTDMHGENSVCLPVTYTRDTIPVTHDQIPKREMIDRWSHLGSIAQQMPDYQPELGVGLLIGSNCPTAHEPLQVVPSQGNGPYAMLLRHGWTINGPTEVQLSGSQMISCNWIALQGIEYANEVILPEAIVKVLQRDFSEYSDCSVDGEDRGFSVNDAKFMKLMNDNVKLDDGHYVLPLPFKGNPSLPNNKSQALKRAQQQKSKMMRDSTYHQYYVDFMTDILQKGYAEPVPVDLKSEDGCIWYLPHHGVYHPRKPGKLRVVFDCSAKFNGNSLNDVLLQGPNLTSTLIGVLTRFRENPVAFMADVQAMFYQVRVPPEHYTFLRFFWWPGGDLHQPMKEYYMRVHLFGAVSSPSVCNFALKRVAVDHKLSSKVESAITEHFYVDDCLMSVEDESLAIELIRSLRSACYLGGFNLTKFTSNSPGVMESIPLEDRSKEQRISIDYNDKELLEHALGIQWNTKTDTFSFSISLPTKPFTRRGVLSMISSIYDPLGFIAPLMLPMKRILQDMCRVTSLTWDDPLPSDIQADCEKWMNAIECMDAVHVPRCLKPLKCISPQFQIQMHTFCDASAYGYGAVIYLRFYDGSSCQVSFLIGKSRVAPIKESKTTIPRLELTAATVGVNIAVMMTKELRLPIQEIFFHTDSTIVLHYIHNECKRFPVFVANRVQRIRQCSQPSQWRYVGSAENPADDASRGKFELSSKSRWLSGPEFLLKPESEWPEQPNAFPSQCDENSCFATEPNAVDQNGQAMDTLLAHYSDWFKLKKACAVYMSLAKILKQRCQGTNGVSTDFNPFTVENVNEAEVAIFKYIQRVDFKNEMMLLDQGNERGRVRISKKSPIYKLNPYMSMGLLRVGGRLAKASLSNDAMHPVILPKRGHVTELIIRNCHERLAHAGRNHVLSLVREKFWVISANSAVRRCINKCVTCKRLRGPCMEQQMADLPGNRLIEAPPFTFTGVDFFGPFLIKDRRSNVKRYGVLFTSLVSCSVHLETANSLETSSFVNALQRFISRRGNVKELRCDNGTNFVGAEKELSKAVSELDSESLQSQTLSRGIKFIFNPPSASHMGGVWERQIRNVRNILAGLLLQHGNQLDDESFRTLLCEVEAILNSRPLTTVSDDPDDLNALSPHQLLTMKPVLSPPPGDFVSDACHRKRWRRVQYLALQFWTRWKREYATTLQTRGKWNQIRRNLQCGDVVLVKDDNAGRYDWPLARVIKALPDGNGIVRSVVVKTGKGEFHRPINKLVLLVPAD